MKTLITGATGFLGTHLVKTLLNEGREVRCLVRRTSSKSSLERLGVELVCGDLLDKDSLKRSLKGASVIYHLGGEVYSSNVEDYYKTNVQGTQNLLETCLDNGAGKFLFFSSIAAMGPNRDKKKPLTEDDICRPISPYGISKNECEKFIVYFSQKYKLPSLIIRPPVVYGPGLNGSSRFLGLLRIIRKGKVIIPGKGDHRISLCYIANLIKGTLLAERKVDLTVRRYILTDKRSYAYNEIIDTIMKETGVEPSKIYVPQSVIRGVIGCMQFARKAFRLSPSVSLARLKEGVCSWDCDISKARKDLGYNPETGIEEGFKTTIRWCQENNL